MTTTRTPAHRRRLKGATLLALALSAVLGISACSSSSNDSSSSASTQGNTLTLAMIGTPVSLDPAVAGPTTLISNLTYLPLIYIDKNAKYQPGLATSWKYVDGSAHKQFELTLRSDAKFSDGTPVTGAAVQAWLEYFIKANGPFANSLGVGTMVSVPKPNTVLISMTTPNPSLPWILAQTNGAGYVASTEALTNDALAKNTYGAGQYVYDAAASVAGDTYTFSPNKYFFDQKAIHWKKIVVKIVSTPTSVEQGIASGQFNGGPGSIGTISAAKSAGVTVVSSVPSVWNGIALLNRSDTADNPMGNLKVRQAMNYAMDRNALVKGLINGEGIPTSSWITYDGNNKASQSAYPFNVKKAKQLLAEAGYSNGFTFNLLTTTSPLAEGTASQTLSQAVAQQLKNIGVTVNITEVSPTEFNSNLTSGKFDGCLYSFGINSYATYYGVFLSTTSIFNMVHKVPLSPELSQLTDEYLTGNDPDAASKEITQYVTDQAYNIPLYAPEGVFFTSKNITNVNIPTNGDFGVGISTMDATQWLPAGN